MSVRRLLSIALILAIGLALWMVWGAGGVAPDAPARAAESGADLAFDSSSPPPARVAPLAALEDADGRPEAVDAAERRELAPGTGRLRVLVMARTAGRRGHATQLVLRAESEQGDATFELHARIDDGYEVAAAVVPARRYRLSVVRGPGDRADADGSRFWVVDPPSDRVAVAAGTTTGHVARVVARVDAPDRGVASIRGAAFVDGAPGRDLVVRLDPLSGNQVRNVAADGSFAFDAAPAGLCAVELCTRILPGSRGASVLVLSRQVVAPPPGGFATVELHATTTVLQGAVRGPDGAPWSQPATLELTGDPVSFPSPIGSDSSVTAAISVPVAADGRFRYAGLPPGRYELQASTDGAGAAAVPFEVPPGVPAVAVDIELRRCVPVSGSVDLSGLPEPGRGSRWLGAHFRGPVDVEVTVSEGRFSTARLIPGRYAVDFRGRGDGFGADLPIEVGGDGASDLRLVPVRR